MAYSRILAIDFGTKRIGLAITDPLGLTVQPLPYLKNSGTADFLIKIKSLISEKTVEKVVMGLPRSLDGSIGPAAVECQNIARKIEVNCNVGVELQDESFTSREADQILIEEMGVSRKKRKEARDSLAACLILKSYLSNL